MIKTKTTNRDEKKKAIKRWDSCHKYTTNRWEKRHQRRGLFKHCTPKPTKEKTLAGGARIRKILHHVFFLYLRTIS